MKKSILMPAAILVLFMGLFASCGDSFLEIKPQAALGVSTLANQPGVEAAMIGAYSLLDGYHIDNNNTWPSDPVNWILGSVPSDDAYKGSEQGDLGEITLLELYQWAPGNVLLNQKFIPLYEGVVRANSTLNLLKVATGVDAIKQTVQGEMLFLRAYYHFELYKVFGHVAYYREDDKDFQKTNDGVDVLAECIADLLAAVPLLPASQSQKGRVNAKAAKAFLGKLYMYQLKYAEAKAQLDPVVSDPSLTLAPCQRDVFTYATENGSEALFSVQMSLSDAAQARNSNWLDQLANPVGGGFGCCGFHQPSQNLVNAFKVDALGLPLHDTFNNVDLAPADKVDPRLDLVVGRDGVPYWDWAIHDPVFIRQRSYSGPYSPKKFQPYATSPNVAGGWNGAANNGVNVPIIRLADAILLLAEAEVELGNLNRAEQLVNMVRVRAAGCAQGPFVSKAGSAVITNNIANPAITWATYDVKPYTGQFAVNGAVYARKAVRFERRLELAMEGHRFFDIRRWDDMAPGYAATLLNGFVAVEKTKRTYYATADPYNTTKHRWYPLPTPQVELSIVGGTAKLKQNTGF